MKLKPTAKLKKEKFVRTGKPVKQEQAKIKKFSAKKKSGGNFVMFLGDDGAILITLEGDKVLNRQFFSQHRGGKRGTLA